nr:MAG: hypothetical protein [Bacteriophage sp.]
MKQIPVGRKKVYTKGERTGGRMKEYFAEIFLFILNCFLWGYLWFETHLLQNYY